MSHVLLATHTCTGNRCALKLRELAPAGSRQCQQEDDALPCAIAECQIALALSGKPAILPCHAAFLASITREPGAAPLQLAVMEVPLMKVGRQKGGPALDTLHVP